MEETRYVFHLSPYDVSALLPQVSRALEAQTEHTSRAQYPGMWRQTDRLRERARARAAQGTKKVSKAHRLLRTLLDIVCLACGLFLLIPGLTAPKELLVPLLTGALAVLVGAFDLHLRYGKRKNPFDKSAERLLRGKDALPEGLTVSFASDGMTLADAAETIPYGDFTCAVETQDLFLLIYRGCATLLQKRDLDGSDAGGFRTFLSGKVPACLDLREN